MNGNLNTSSPCVKVCRIENGVCKGCFRTLEEIGGWRTYTDEQKHEVNLKVMERKNGVSST